MGHFNIEGIMSYAGLDSWITGNDNPPTAEGNYGPAVPANGGVYRGFTISYNPKPGPTSAGVDWDYIHPDYDGAADAHDRRYGCCSSPAECAREIDEYYEQFEDDEQLRFETERGS